MRSQPMKLPLEADCDNELIVTSVGFADRQASLQAAVDFDTEKAIAELYAHVAQMPDSAQKQRLMKQVSQLTACSGVYIQYIKHFVCMFVSLSVCLLLTRECETNKANDITVGQKGTRL